MVFNKYNDSCYKKVKGDKGAKGDIGDVGDKGDRGPRGDRGETGDKGPKGDAGDAGDKGDRGPKGIVGPRGPLGDAGPKGPTGPKGDIGARGEDGDIGETGDKGPIGPQGDKGDKGPAGTPGDRGMTGAIGAPGPAGEKGDRGPRGDKGATGEDGEKGPIGFAGAKGETGEEGPKGRQGFPGFQGNIGFGGPKNYAIPMPGEIMMKKVLKYIQNRSLPLTVALNTPANVNLEGIGGLSRLTKIAKIEFDCLYLSDTLIEPLFPSDLVIPIGNIQAINVEYDTSEEALRDRHLEELREIFNETMMCGKNAPQTVPLNSNGEPTEIGDLSVDYEYVVDCTCNGSRCDCIAKKIDLCRYSSYESNYLSIAMEEIGKGGLTVRKIITRSGEDVTNLNRFGNIGFDTPLKIGPRGISSITTSYTYQNHDAGGLTTRHGWTFINLDKALVVEYNS